MIVITLGHRLRGPSIHPHLRRRVDAGLEALQATEAAALCCTGGRVNESVPRTEAEAMRAYALTSVADDRVLVENRALDTIGNAYFSRRLLDKSGIELDTVHLVTADFHVDRARIAFEHCFANAEITTAFAIETIDPSLRPDPNDRRIRIERTRSFFDPIEPGDLAAIERRLLEDHDCYGPAAFEDIAAVAPCSRPGAVGSD